MPEAKTFAQKMMKAPLRGDGDGEVREALGKERQHSGRAFELEVRFKDGRHAEALAWALYQRRQWRDVGGDSEGLVLLFAHAAVSIEGHHLHRLTEMIREERLEMVQEHDQAEARLTEVENASLQPLHRKAIITAIRVEPGFEIAYQEATTDREDARHGREIAR